MTDVEAVLVFRLFLCVVVEESAFGNFFAGNFTEESRAHGGIFGKLRLSESQFKVQCLACVLCSFDIEGILLPCARSADVFHSHGVVVGGSLAVGGPQRDVGSVPRDGVGFYPNGNFQVLA